MSAALITFLVNTVLGSFVALTIPSLLIPFAGFAIGVYRALILGIALAPSTPELAAAMIPHSLTILLEGQGYVLAMFGSYLLWARALRSRHYGYPGFQAGYMAGLKVQRPPLPSHRHPPGRRGNLRGAGDHLHSGQAVRSHQPSVRDS